MLDEVAALHHELSQAVLGYAPIEGDQGVSIADSTGAWT